MKFLLRSLWIFIAVISIVNPLLAIKVNQITISPFALRRGVCFVISENGCLLKSEILQKPKVFSKITSVENKRFVQVNSCFDFSLILSENGEVFEIKFTQDNNVLSPLSLVFLTVPISQVACSNKHGLLLSAHGIVYFKGRFLLENKYKLNRYKDVIIEHNEWSIIKHPSKHKIVSLATSETAVFFINSRGRVFSFGNNYSGKLGHQRNIHSLSKPTKISALRKMSIKSIASSSNSTVVLNTKGEAYVFGSFHLQKNHIHTVMETNLPNRIFNNVTLSMIHSGLNGMLFVFADKLKLFFKSASNLAYPISLSSFDQKNWVTQISDPICCVSTGSFESYFVTNNGQIYVINSSPLGWEFIPFNEPTALHNLRWRKENHWLFKNHIRENIKIMLIKERRKQHNKNKIPKPILFLIFSFITQEL